MRSLPRRLVASATYAAGPISARHPWRRIGCARYRPRAGAKVLTRLPFHVVCYPRTCFGRFTRLTGLNLMLVVRA